MDWCEQANDLAHNVVFHIILVAVIIISTIAIFLEIWIMFNITNRILIHQNTRILIIVHQLWLIIHCIARVIAHTYVLIQYQKTHADPCEYLAIRWKCFVMRAPITLTLLLNATSIPTIVIERALATYFSSKYEKFSKKIAIFLVIAQCTVGIGNFLFLISDFDMFDSMKVVYCSTANAGNALKSAITFGTFMIIDFISALIFPVLYFINKRSRLTKIHANLSQRYQFMENINSLQILSPMIAFHSILVAFYMGALFLPFVGVEFSRKQFAVYLESVQQTPIFALTLPIAIVWTEKHVRKTTAKTRQKAIDLKGTEAADYYFRVFEGYAGKNA
uniref:G-protein coupled receptors family 1 profile domain-containing protein n=1 Tax=Onchocerca volvulus TaxID=6282 RepID=A0A8R1TM30_ONCVO